MLKDPQGGSGSFTFALNPSPLLSSSSRSLVVRGTRFGQLSRMGEGRLGPWLTLSSVPPAIDRIILQKEPIKMVHCTINGRNREENNNDNIAFHK